MKEGEEEIAVSNSRGKTKNRTEQSLSQDKGAIVVVVCSTFFVCEHQSRGEHGERGEQQPTMCGG